MVVWCRVSTKRKIQGEEEGCSFDPMQTRSHTLLTDHRAGSVHLNILFTCVCTDVRYWRGGVPINLWSLTPQICYG